MRLGLEFVRRMVAEQSIAGVYGAVYELFSCEERFLTAVEVAAGDKSVAAAVGRGSGR